MMKSAFQSADDFQMKFVRQWLIIQRCNTSVSPFTKALMARFLSNSCILFIDNDTLIMFQKLKEYPIFRNAQPPDDIVTLVTCVFDLNAKRLTIYYGHPINEEEQRATYSMQS